MSPKAPRMKIALGEKTLKEIREEPATIRNTFQSQAARIKEISTELGQRKPNRVFLVGSGTSYHAGVFGAYVLNALGEILAIPVQASEFEAYVANAVNPHDVVIALSQSGESTDTLKALRVAKKRGALVVGVTNMPGSTIVLESHHSIVTVAGVEESVVATKTFQAQLAVMALLAAELCRELGSLGAERVAEIRHLFEEVATMISENLDAWDKQTKKIAMRLKPSRDVFVLGFGEGFALALEAGLKLKEASLTHSEAFSIAEFKHGPISLVTRGVAVIVIAPSVEEKVEIAERLILELKQKRATVITIIEQGKRLAQGKVDFEISIPRIDALLAPMLQIVPIQLLAYNLALVRSVNPDSPRHLTKVVR